VNYYYMAADGTLLFLAGGTFGHTLAEPEAERAREPRAEPPGEVSAPCAEEMDGGRYPFCIPTWWMAL
jgi:hypothetical protein